mmetsp:Transcript_73755/g.123193  ORF Transcript_73755/g.123193 Transcript_73755/m.123193 type:complete len:82 (-) Transcript_73755:1344-1589(-)
MRSTFRATLLPPSFTLCNLHLGHARCFLRSQYNALHNVTPMTNALMATIKPPSNTGLRESKDCGNGGEDDNSSAVDDEKML